MQTQRALRTLSDAEAKESCHLLNARVPESGLFRGAKRPVLTGSRASWRIAPEPFFISPQTLSYLETLGNHLLAFYRAANRLYLRSLRGTLPSLFHEYLDIGKGETVWDYGRMNRFKHDLPAVIRPDLLLTSEGFTATELDAVPGGIGLTASMQQHYADVGFCMAGGDNGMVEGFAEMVRSQAGQPDPRLAIVVSDESDDYRPEMRWLTEHLNHLGLRSSFCAPEELTFTERGLYAEGERIDVLYRFFELYDLKNIPKYDLILYAVRKELVRMTPPVKAYLEEKALFALFHHPALTEFWQEEMDAATFAALRQVLPYTWILDPRPLPPHAVIPELRVQGRVVTSWEQLKGLSQKERRLVIKPSGFSALAWGSRGVTVGHDHSVEEWDAAVDTALASFSTTPYILQRFHQSRLQPVRYFDFARETVRQMEGRVRLSPYYFVQKEEAKLAGILATIVPSDKKLIHGMTDAVMVPAAIAEDGV
jgi:hypothetical protein